MLNVILEGRRKMEELFEKIDFILAQNTEIIGGLLVPVVKKEPVELGNLNYRSDDQ